jgi:hypothetical protein
MNYEEYLAEVRIILEYRARFMNDYLEPATEDEESTPLVQRNMGETLC